jgi:hypothetical protein
MAATTEPLSDSYTAIAKLQAVRAKDGPSGTERIDVAMPLTYVWDYSSERTDLRALYEKSKDLMWNARTDLAWETHVEPEGEVIPDALIPIYGSAIWNKLDPKKEIPNLRRHIGSYVLSNFLHGEQGALLATAQIAQAAPTNDAKLYAAAQVFDEARHVEAYDRYLREKFELVYPVSPHLKQLLDTILQDQRWDFKYLGMQIMVEGLALGAFGMVEHATREPLIKDIVGKVMQDESRHVAFGVLSLRGTYETMNERELKDREDFVIEASNLLYKRFLGQEVWERLGLPQRECEEAANASQMMGLFRKLLFSKIVPNIKRLGLLTERVRKGFDELGVLEYESWEPGV